MSGMYAIPLCVPINRAYKGVKLGFGYMHHVCLIHLLMCIFTRTCSLKSLRSLTDKNCLTKNQRRDAKWMLLLLWVDYICCFAEIKFADVFLGREQGNFSFLPHSKRQISIYSLGNFISELKLFCAQFLSNGKPVKPNEIASK